MLTPELRQALRNMLVRHEGLKKYPYVDSVGKITIGIGFNLTDRGMTDNWINQQYEEDVLYFYNQLMVTFDWYQRLDQVRQIALIDMCFMGWKKFLGFKKMLSALAISDYRLAAFEMLDSKWADQVGNRAKELADIIATGAIDRG